MCTRKVAMLLLSFGLVVLITLAGANSIMAGGHTLEEGLILCLPFDEKGRRDTVEDLSDTGLAGTVHGKAHWVEGIEGEAINFDGETAYVNLPASDVLNQASEKVSFALWFNATKVPEDVGWSKRPILLARGRQGDFTVFLLDGSVGAYANTIGGFLELELPDVAVEADRWYHVVVTYEAPIGKLYLDGELAVETESKGAAIRYLDDDWTQFGAFRGQQQFYEGVIDEIRIYDRALPPEEVAQMWSISFAVSSRGKLTTTWGKIKEH